jgi:type IV pilus assembly protein PilO
MDLGIEKISKFTNKQKLLLMLVILLFVSVALFFLLIRPKYDDLKELESKLSTLQTQIQKDRATAAKLPALQKEYARLNNELEAALTELPDQKQIPALLTSVTDEGKNAGLEFLVFRPKPEEIKEFYAAVPVDITIYGPYRSVGQFFNAVGSLPRIMNITNVSFSDIKSDGSQTNMKVTCLATTFRFLSKNEQNTAKEKKNEKKAK